MKNKTKQISEEIHESRKSIRELDKLMNELQGYFVKVEDKINNKRKWLREALFFLLGIAIGIAIPLMDEFIKGLI